LLTGHSENDPSAKTSAAKTDKQPRKSSSRFTTANRSSQTTAPNAPAKDPRFIVDAPLIAQYPQLPRGCEVTRFAMMLNHAGIHVSKMTLARQVKKDLTPYKVKDGNTYFGNLNTARSNRRPVCPNSACKVKDRPVIHPVSGIFQIVHVADKHRLKKANRCG